MVRRDNVGGNVPPGPCGGSSTRICLIGRFSMLRAIRQLAEVNVVVDKRFPAERQLETYRCIEAHGVCSGPWPSGRNHHMPLALCSAWPIVERGARYRSSGFDLLRQAASFDGGGRRVESKHMARWQVAAVVAVACHAFAWEKKCIVMSSRLRCDVEFQVLRIPACHHVADAFELRCHRGVGFLDARGRSTTSISNLVI